MRCGRTTWPPGARRPRREPVDVRGGGPGATAGAAAAAARRGWHSNYSPRRAGVRARGLANVGVRQGCDSSCWRAVCVAVRGVVRPEAQQ